MALDEALYELTGAGLVACAAGLGLTVPPGAVRAGDAFVGFLSQRGAWGEINRLVEELKREIVAGAAGAVSPALFARHGREAVVLLDEIRPDPALLRAVFGRSADGGPPGSVARSPPAAMIASEMLARASGAGGAAAGPSPGAGALVHLLLSHILREPFLLLGLESALQEFLAVTFVPPAVPARAAAPVPPMRTAAAPPATARSLWPPAPIPPTAPSSAQALHSADDPGLGAAFAANLITARVVETLERIRQARGLTHGAYARFLRTLEAQACAPEAVPQRLDEMAGWLVDLIGALTRPSNEDADTRRLKAEAAGMLAEGDLEGAVQRLKQVRRAVREGRRRIEERLREDILLLDQEMAGEAAIIARQAEMELTRRDYAAAAELFAEARDSLPRGDRQATWLYGLRQAEALFRLGDEFGDPAALAQSVQAYAACLATTGQHTAPDGAWAMARLNMGNALLALGERERSIGRYRDAIVCFEDALTLHGREAAPQQWALIQTNLANALAAVGEATRDAGALEAAAIAYRQALDVLGSDRHDQPDDAAMRRAIAELNLGTVLVRLAGHREPRRHWHEAKTVMLSALHVFQARQAHDHVAIAQLNLRNLDKAAGSHPQALAS